LPRWLRLFALNSGLVAAGVCALLWSMPSDPQSSEAQRPVWIFYDSSATNAYRIATAIARADGHVRYASSWLHAVSADVDPSRLRSVTGVTLIRRVGRLYAAASTASPMLMQQRLDSASYGPNYSALRDLGVPQAHGPRLGLTGAGVRIAIIDTGFETAHDAFVGARIVMQRDFINNDGDVRTEFGEPVGGRDQEVHGTWTWSVLGGNRAGQIIGPAFGADFLLAKVDVEPVHGNDLVADEDRWIKAVEWAGENGAKVIVSALAYRDFVDRPDYTLEQLDGNTTPVSVAADAAVARGIVLVTAMGNTPGPAGFASLFAPADADSVISVGAVDRFGSVWFRSARGPTADSRVKPELVARGVDVWAADALNPTMYQPVTGTSVSAALIGGVAALFREAWSEFTAATVRDALMLSGSLAATPPDNARGSGIPNVASAIMFPRGLRTSQIDFQDNGHLTTISPVFVWTSEGVVHPKLQPIIRYRLELATDPQFNNIFRVDTITNAFSITLRQPLRPTPFFWWRVVAEADAGPGVPIIRRATPVSGPFDMPAWVTLTTMNDPGTAIVKTARPEFRWHPLDSPPPNGPLQFDLQILTLRGDIVRNLPNLIDTIFTLPATQQLTANSTYRWRVIARAVTGVADTVNSRGSFLVDTDTDPPTTSLYPSFPNPFPREDLGEASTHFWFDLADSTKVELTIHDLRGRLVRTLISASCPALQKGEYGRGNEALTCGQTTWDGRNEDGALVPRGVYIARLRANSKVSTQRILFTPRQ
jgi:hypothetical protein